MPRYFFDVHIDSHIDRDEDGTPFRDLEEVRKAAQSFLPAVGFDEIPRDGDRRTVAVLVTDEEGRAVYSATLNYTGIWLIR